MCRQTENGKKKKRLMCYKELPHVINVIVETGLATWKPIGKPEREDDEHSGNLRTQAICSL